MRALDLSGEDRKEEREEEEEEEQDVCVHVKEKHCVRNHFILVYLSYVASFC